MPDRFIREEYGEDRREAKLSAGAYLALPFLWRSTDAFGCVKYNIQYIRDKAFVGRVAPTAKQLEAWIEEYKANDLVVVYDTNLGPFLWVTSWFRDNYYPNKCKPKAPRPPVLEGTISEKDWNNGDQDVFRKLFRESRGVSGSPTDSPYRVRERERVRVRGEGENSSLPKDTGKFGTDFYNIFSICFRNKAPNPIQQQDGKKLEKKYGWSKLKKAMSAMRSGGYGWGVDGANVAKYLRGDWDKPRGTTSNKGPSRDNLGKSGEVK